MFLASTFPPGSAPPEGSSTLPWMTPVVIWDWAAAYPTTNRHASRVRADTRSMRILSIGTLLRSLGGRGASQGPHGMAGTIVEGPGTGQGNDAACSGDCTPVVTRTSRHPRRRTTAVLRVL